MKSLTNKKAGDRCHVNNIGKAAEIVEVCGAVTMVRFLDGSVSVVPTHWIIE